MKVKKRKKWKTTKTYNIANPLRLDPTRTTGLRNRFAMELRRRFARIKALLYKLVVEEDAFGLRMTQNVFCPTGEGGGIDPTCSLHGQHETIYLLKDDDVRTNWTTDYSNLPHNTSVENSSNPIKTALKSYTKGGDEEINGVLRGTKETSTGTDKKIKAIKKAFEENGEGVSYFNTWRGVNLPDHKRMEFINDAKKSLETGEPIIGKGFTSTSIQFEVATAQFSSINAPLLIEVTTKKGLYLQPLSKFEEEHEVLINHGTKFVVTGIKKLKYLKRGKPNPIEIETIQMTVIGEI